MRWIGLYVVLAAVPAVASVDNFLEWQRNGEQRDLVMAVLLALCTPAWILHWRRDRGRVGL